MALSVPSPGVSPSLQVELSPIVEMEKPLTQHEAKVEKEAVSKSLKEVKTELTTNQTELESVQGQIATKQTELKEATTAMSNAAIFRGSPKMSFKEMGKLQQEISELQKTEQTLQETVSSLQSQVNFLSDSFEKKALSIDTVMKSVTGQLQKNEQQISQLKNQIESNTGRLQSIKDNLGIFGKVKVTLGLGQKADAIKGLQKMIVSSQAKLNNETGTSAVLNQQMTALTKLKQETSPQEVAARCAARFEKQDANNPLFSSRKEYANLNDCLKLISICQKKIPELKARLADLERTGGSAEEKANIEKGISDLEKNLKLQLDKEKTLQTKLNTVREDLQDCKNRLGNQPVGAKILQDINHLEECERSQNYSTFVEKQRTPTDLLSAVINHVTMSMLSVKFGERPETETLINLLKEGARHDPQNSAALLRCASALERVSDLLSVEYTSIADKKAVEKELRALKAEINSLEIKGNIKNQADFAFASVDAKARLNSALTTVIESIYLPLEVYDIVKDECTKLDGQYKLGTKPDLSGISNQLQSIKQRGDKQKGGVITLLQKPMTAFTGIKNQPGVPDKQGIMDKFSELIENKANLPLSEVKAKLQELYVEASKIDANVIGKVDKKPGMWTHAAIEVVATICAHIDQASKSLT